VGNSTLQPFSTHFLLYIIPRQTLLSPSQPHLLPPPLFRSLPPSLLEEKEREKLDEHNNNNEILVIFLSSLFLV